MLQSGTAVHLATSLAALLALVTLLRLGFIWLGRHVVPYAPGSEFSLLLTFGVVAAYLTYQLGVYYLVGAFLAGVLAKSLSERLPTLASTANLHAIELFASFFVPFYFFNRGIVTPHQAFGIEAIGLGLALSAVLLPLRIAIVWAQRRWIQGEDRATSLRVATALTPTLVFTLVIASLLRERYGIAQSWYGALLVYAGISTIIPAWLMARRQPAAQSAAA
ncbi:sodium/hydrogen exchanger family protein [mine drainage metagenome]|uniref:Sodium/hydrogen exchanger family protein n=1 Tax=mine drainage metagenome TaxID=410659 RepID=A0A1J5QFS7_9ZZZZ